MTLKTCTPSLVSAFGESPTEPPDPGGERGSLRRRGRGGACAAGRGAGTGRRRTAGSSSAPCSRAQTNSPTWGGRTRGPHLPPCQHTLRVAEARGQSGRPEPSRGTELRSHRGQPQPGRGAARPGPAAAFSLGGEGPAPAAANERLRQRLGREGAEPRLTSTWGHPRHLHPAVLRHLRSAIWGRVPALLIFHPSSSSCV